MRNARLAIFNDMMNRMSDPEDAPHVPPGETAICMIGVGMTSLSTPERVHAGNGEIIFAASSLAHLELALCEIGDTLERGAPKRTLDERMAYFLTFLDPWEDGPHAVLKQIWWHWVAARKIQKFEGDPGSGRDLEVRTLAVDMMAYQTCGQEVPERDFKHLTPEEVEEILEPWPPGTFATCQ